MCQLKVNYPFYDISKLQVEFPYGFDINNPNNLLNPDITEIGSGPGYYCLGKQNIIFQIHYVGRSDKGITEEIKKRQAVEPKLGDLFYFVYNYETNEIANFVMESVIYHSHGGKDVLLNDRHPKRPDGFDTRYPGLDCPCEGCTELEEE